LKLPVAWSDRVSRANWFTEYTTIGSLPDFVREIVDGADERLINVLSQAQVLSKKSRPRKSSQDASLIAGLLLKVLQRGRAPLPTLSIEQAAIDRRGLRDLVVDDGQTELQFRLATKALQAEGSSILSHLCRRSIFSLDEDLSSGSNLFDSERERIFIKTIVPKIFGPQAGQWFWPQASLDTLLQQLGENQFGGRRVDFLVAHPIAGTLAIEIDGDDHRDDPVVDADRDASLAQLGIQVLRIPNSEIDAGYGPALQSLETSLSALKEGLTSKDGLNVAEAINDCQRASKFQFALAKALQFGWLTHQTCWRIQTVSEDGTALSATLDFLEMLSALDCLYGVTTAPDEVNLSDGGRVYQLTKKGGAWSFKSTRKKMSGDDVLSVAVSGTAGPFQLLTQAELAADIVIRPCYLPLTFALSASFANVRRPVAQGDAGQQTEAVRTFLRQIFRKKNFRPLQAEACLNTLRQIDSVVLLPTGAGKSIIYQLAGLLMPGVTMVVDPIVSLIEDQVEGMANYGIDRVAAITSMVSSEHERRQILLGVERGEYQFVLHSPVRLQSPAFRTTLRALAETSLINLAVIDEAHCVSEWGHDFVPAYLNLGRNIREFCKDSRGIPPPLLALTGTASRAVLRDLLTELDIDRSQPDALIRPASFDRSELRFRISRPGRATDVDAALRGTLNALPELFGIPKSEFYRPSGKETASGIIFVPFVDGRTHGVLHVKDEVTSTTHAPTTVYSGRAPNGLSGDWETQKRANVKQFKCNETPILVSTKAFGMGIDKPNIRFTVHVGMPGSLEAFYQEAGRAGRDRKVAQCAVIFSEHDPARTDFLLNPSLDLSEVKERYEEVAGRKSVRDDVTRALWFHLNSFSGEDDEIAAITDMLASVPLGQHADEVRVPFHSDERRNQDERALHRLVRLGVVRDYEVDYGSRYFTVYTRGFDPEFCRNSVILYVRGSQPGRAKSIAQQLEAIPADDISHFVHALAKIFVDFVYDVIERSRRRAIQEAVLLARNSVRDEEIRQRLLDYLQEGLGAEQLQTLIDRPDIDFAPWFDMLEKAQTAIEAGEIRGLAIRALESYPDHPGLLVLRAVSEMLCPDADDGIAHQALEVVMEQAPERYAINVNELANLTEWLCAVALQQTPAMAIPLALAFANARNNKSLPADIAEQAMASLRATNSPAVCAVTCAGSLSEISDELARGVSLISNVANDDNVLKLLGVSK
jgi:ATP-dependent DNA helicase RecQ